MSTKQSQDGLDLLADALVEHILNTTDEDLLAEVSADGDDPDKVADHLRALYDKTYTGLAKRKLISAQDAVRKEGERHVIKSSVSSLDARRKLKAAIEQSPDLAENLTLAARNGDQLSDRDIEGILEDLRDLGVLDDDP